MNKLTFQEVIKNTTDIIERFKKIEGKQWNAEGALMELTKQVGELAKLIMVHEKYYFKEREKIDTKYKVSKEMIGDELADILFVIIRLANFYNIDLEDAHINARKGEDESLKKKGV